MTTIKPSTFKELASIEWRFGSEKFRVLRSDLLGLGLMLEVNEDDGIDLEVAAFHLPGGALAALARGVGKDDDVWVVMVPVGSTASSDDVLSALGVSYRREP